jgi:hypothetical protein
MKRIDSSHRLEGARHDRLVGFRRRGSDGQPILAQRTIQTFVAYLFVNASEAARLAVCPSAKKMRGSRG